MVETIFKVVYSIAHGLIRGLWITRVTKNRFNGLPGCHQIHQKIFRRDCPGITVPSVPQVPQKFILTADLVCPPSLK
jgi:hypothetical protein